MRSASAEAERRSSEDRLRHLRDRVPGKGEWRFNDGQVDWAAAVVDSLGLEQRIDHWREQEGMGSGGVAGRTPVRALLVAMVLGARENLPQLATTYTNVLYKHLSPAKRAEFNIATPPARSDIQGWQNVYRSVVRRLHTIFDSMDPSPLPKNRRLTPDQFQAASKEMTPEAIGVRYDRLSWFCNQIIEASIATLPREFRRRWNGNVGLDATPIPAYSDYNHCTFKDKDGKSVVDTIITHASDPDAGPYIRDVDHRDPASTYAVPGRKVKKTMFAHELSITIIGPDALSDDDGTFPGLISAMAPLHRPGADPGHNGVVALRSMQSRGHPTGRISCDNAYTQAKPEKFALPAKALGFELVLDYKVDQLGIQGEYGGALLVEGRFYCPSIPPTLIMATEDYRYGRIAEEIWQQRLNARIPYELRPNQTAGADGHLRMLCPAAGAAATARCSLKPKSNSRKHAGKKRIEVRDAANPPLICRQATVTVPPAAFDRFGQPHRYGTPQWKAAYSLLRNAIEGGNGHLKDGAGPAIKDPSRRRIRGIAAQSVFVALAIFAMNLDRIVSFLKRAVVGDDGTIRTRAKEAQRSRRLTESLQIHRPAPLTGDPPTSFT